MSSLEGQEPHPLVLFYSYADQDEALCTKLKKHLNLLQKRDVISEWDHRMISVGGDMSAIRRDYLSSAHIILLLISPDFMASDVTFKEMQQALQYHDAGQAYVIPILLRPYDWKHAPFAHLQVLPRNGKAVTIWRNRDLAFVEIVGEIRFLLAQTLGPVGRSFSTLQKIVLPSNPFVFLSYAREEEDLSFVNRLKDGLEAHNIRGWIDHTAHLPGSPDEEEDLRVAIRNASAVVLVVSVRTHDSRSVKDEISIARMYQRPIYLYWMEGNRLTQVIPTSFKGLPSFDARAELYTRALEDLVQVLGQTSPAQHLTVEKTTASAVATPRNPYKGLHAFRGEDAGDFFGRDGLVDELVGQVRSQLTTSTHDEEEVSGRLLAVLGPSGSGKSSTVMAGLVPRLQKGTLPGSQDWVYLDVIVPGVYPLEALVLALTPLFPQLSPGSIRNDLQDDSVRGLHVLLTAYVKQSNKRVILVVDQFEELFTQTVAEEERQRFLDLLFIATTEPRGSLFVILTLRADFYGRLLLYPEFGRLIKKYHIPIYPMGVQELRAVIERPASLPDVQVTFEGNLVGDLLFDIRGQAGTLPLLQFTLDHLFQRREARMLTLRAYHGMGGVRGALAQHAERIYQSLPTPNHQQLAQALFSRLIDPGTLEAEATKRRIPQSAFTLIDPAKTEVLAKIIEIFTRERLLIINTVREVAMVEVSHEALIGAWTRLQDWLHEARDTIHLQQAISQDATAWIQHERSTDRLYRGAQLAEALAWRDSNIPNIDEDAFLQASVEEQQRVQAQVQEQRRRYTRRVLIISGIGGVGMVGSGLAVYLLRRDPSPQIIHSPEKKLPYAYTRHTEAVNSVAWSPDSTRIASTSWDGTVQVWEARSNTLHFSYGKRAQTVTSAAWSPDGKRIVSCGWDKTVQIWDASNGTRFRSYTGHTSTVRSVAWSPDGKHIVSADDEKTIQIWDASNGTRLLSYDGHTQGANSVAWSPDSKLIASAGWTVQVWDASKSHLFFTLEVYGANGVAWSPDGKYIASAGDDQTVQVWDASNGAPRFPCIGHTDRVGSVAWEPSGKRIVSCSWDKTVRIWNASNGAHLFTYVGHTSYVNSVAWSPDSKLIASASYDRTVWVWDASNGVRLLNYRDHTSYVNSVAWSHDSKLIASASTDTTVRIWDASNGSLYLSYKQKEHAMSKEYTSFSVNYMAWSPDSKLIASASDKVVQVWDASNGSLIHSYTGHTSMVSSMGWSPDSKRIVSGSQDKTVQVWDARSGSPSFSYAHDDGSYVHSVAWSPDGKLIASAGNKVVQIWDAHNGTRLYTYTDNTVGVGSMCWSPDSKRIVSVGIAGSVEVWDVSSGTTLVSYTGHRDLAESVAWSPDGKHIASAGFDKTVQVWDADNGTHVLTYNGHTSTVTSVAWSPDGMRIVSGSEDETAQVWWML